MNIKWALLIPIIIILTILGRERQQYHNVYRILLILVISFISGFGGIASTDHYNYAESYRMFANDGFHLQLSNIIDLSRNGFEVGYSFLMLLCHKIGLGEAGFFMVVAIITNTMPVLYLYKHSYPVLSIIALFFVFGYMGQQTNLVRQYLAIGIMFGFLDSLFEGNLPKYLLGVVIASMFHFSAFIYLLLIPIYFIRSSKTLILLKFVLLSLLAVSIVMAFGFIHLDVLRLVNLTDRYAIYSTTDNTMGITLSISFAVIFSSLSIITIVFSLNINIKYLSIISIAAIMSNISFPYPNLARLVAYFSAFATIYFIQYLDPSLYHFHLSTIQNGRAVRNNKVDHILFFFRYGIVLYSIFVLVRIYMFSDLPLMSEMYSLSDLFQ